LAENVFWVPKEARWKTLQDKAKQSDIGVVVDDAMEAIERENPILKGVLPKDYAKESLDKRRLGELIDIFSTLSMHEGKHSGKDLLVRCMSILSVCSPMPRDSVAESSIRHRVL